MAADAKRTLSSLRSARDLRSEILALATELVGSDAQGQLLVRTPLISPATVQRVWDGAMSALEPSIRRRMNVVIDRSPPLRGRPTPTGGWGIMQLDRPNFRYEVLRQLVGTSLGGGGLQSVGNVAEKIGASQPTVRAALAVFQQAGLCRRWKAHYEVDAKDVSVEYMAQLGALPQTPRFRFAQGTYPRPPAELVSRAMLLLGPEGPPAWAPFALSGNPVALANVPEVDLLGTPRLDLAAYAPKEARSMDVREALRLLDPRLEPEANVLAPAPVVVTLVRAKPRTNQHAVDEQVRCVAPTDVLLALLEVGLREQAYQYAQGLKAQGSRP